MKLSNSMTFVVTLVAILQGNTVESVGCQTIDVRLLEIQRHIKNTRQNIRSIKVLHKSISKNPDDPFIQVRLAAKFSGHYFHDAGKGTEYLDVNRDALRQTAYLKPNDFVNAFPFERSFFRRPVTPTDPLPGSHRNNFYFLATGIWPFEKRETPKHKSGRKVMLFEVFDDLKALKLRSKIQEIDGRACFVVENTVSDVIYLDSERNCCLVRRDLFDLDTGLLNQRFLLKEFVEASPGIWLPTLIHNQSFNFQSIDPLKRHELMQDSVIEVPELAVNEPIPDSVFHYNPPPGAVQINQKDRFEFPKQVVPGGLDHLDHLAQWAGGGVTPTAPTQTKTAGVGRILWSYWFIALFGLFVLANETHRFLVVKRV